jgi:predicted nucleotidyltransferase
MHIYGFGSICRGEVDLASDIDLLAIVEGRDPRFDPDTFSIYGYDRIKAIWQEGSPFAWHLSLEARLLHASDERDFLRDLGRPERYLRSDVDCAKFRSIFSAAYTAIKEGSPSRVFELSSIFLAVRNIATCYSLGVLERPDFSRRSALRLEGDSLDIESEVFELIERARILSTRGHGSVFSDGEISRVIARLDLIESWMDRLVAKAQGHRYE